MWNRVLFAERSGELRWLARLSRQDGAEGNQSLNRAFSQSGVDPKPVTIHVRMKLP